MNVPQLHPKVVASVSGATLAGALVTLGVYIAGLYGAQIPGPVSDALTTLVAAGFALIGGYITPSQPPSGQGTP